MQQTTFPFYAVVHDDASTDDSAAIIREYAEKYPERIKPIFETENQYRKADGSITRIMREACKAAKYIALCEGDDYWTDPHKLQKQIDWLETHPEYSLVCSAATIATFREGDYTYTSWSYADHDCDVPYEDLIEQHGRMAQTAGMVYRRSASLTPPEVPTCSNGDFRLQLITGLNGKVRYLADNMFVYRYMTPGSWGSRQKSHRSDKVIHDQLTAFMAMTEALNHHSQQQYEHSFCFAQAKYITFILDSLPRQQRKKALKNFGYILKTPGLCRANTSNRGLLRKLFHLTLRLLYFPYQEDLAHPWLAGGVRGSIVRFILKMREIVHRATA